MTPDTITTAEVTNKAALDEIGGLLVTTLEDAYNAVRKLYPEIPPAVILISSSPPKRNRQIWGHFASSRWDVQGQKLSEIMISAEGLNRPPREVLATVVHEATHGLCFARGINDTSDNGRHHNTEFKRVAEELGLHVEKVPKKQRGGWTVTSIPEGTYDDIVKNISLDLIAYREVEVAYSQNRTPRVRTEHSYRCSCPRTIRVHVSIYEQGDILCAACGDPFL